MNHPKPTLLPVANGTLFNRSTLSFLPVSGDDDCQEEITGGNAMTSGGRGHAPGIRGPSFGEDVRNSNILRLIHMYACIYTYVCI